MTSWFSVHLSLLIVSCIAYASSSSLRTTLCVRFKSEVVACGVVYAAARRFQVPLPENPPWWKAFDADKSGIDEVCRVLAHLYSLPKAQYIPVCKDGGSFTTSNKSWDLSPQPPRVSFLCFAMLRHACFVFLNFSFYCGSISQMCIV